MSKFLIKNQAEFQVFITLFSSAIVGLSGKTTDENMIIQKADKIACLGIERFNTHIPTAEDIATNSGKKPYEKPELIKLK